MTRLVRSAALLLCALAALPALAQTAPTPFDLATGDYTFSAWAASSPAGTYPVSMRLHRGPGQDPALAAEPTADYTLAYNLTSGTRINGLDADGLAFGNTGSPGDLGAAVVALNTTGLSNVRVAWTGGTVATGTRPYAIRLQYRVGASGTFVDAPGPAEYVASASAGDSQSFSTVLPADANGKPVVQVRWKYYQTESGAGGRPRLRLDDITISTSDAAASGTGTAVFARTAVRGGQTETVSLLVEARSDEPADRITDVAFTLPAGFPAPASVTLSPAGGTATVDGQTILVSGASATLSTPLRIDLNGLAVPDVSLITEVGVRTGAGSPQTVAIAEQPLLRVWSTPEPISAVRANTGSGVSTRLGQTVTVRGVVTVAGQFVTSSGERGPSNVEDATGGLAVFSPDGVAAETTVGDEVTLLGRVDQFFGLNQLDNTTVVVERHGAPGAVPTLATLAQLASDGAGGVEQYEGRLVRVDGVTVNTAVWTAEGAGTNYTLTDATGTLSVRVNPGTTLAGTPAPSAPFSIVGVLSQFKTAAPFIGGYQLQPRSAADVTDDTDAPTIAATVPFETAATPTSVTLHWTTDQPAHSEVRYVTAAGTAGEAVDQTRTTDHTVTLSGLTPATIYTLQIRSAADADTAVVAGYPVSTRSAPGTTEAIEVTFNHAGDASVATGPVSQNVDFNTILIPRLNAATLTADVALYSLSGSVGREIGDALLAAKARGVRVRLIVDDATNPDEPARLRAAGLPVIDDGFGANDGNDGLHHNKFIVIDRASADPTRAWVMTGSWNPTDSGTRGPQSNYQNVVWIQDGALAGAYTAEFEQEWGSSTATPDPATSRFHSRKTLVNPTAFWIGDTPTRLFFSPQGFGPYGSVEAEINQALATADFEVALNLNLITRQSYLDVLRERTEAGVTVRAAIGDVGTTGSVFAPLAVFADAHAFPSTTLGLLHHKVAIVDGQHPDSDPIVITGSHNWSRTANENNNENTIFLHNASVANLYLQEFAARFAEAGGTGTFPTGAEAVGGLEAFALSAAYPNPTRGAARLVLHLPEASRVTVRVFNVLGQEVARPLDGQAGAGAREVTVETGGLAAGVYVVRAEATAGGRAVAETRRLTVVR